MAMPTTIRACLASLNILPSYQISDLTSCDMYRSSQWELWFNSSKSAAYKEKRFCIHRFIFNLDGHKDDNYKGNGPGYWSMEASFGLRGCLRLRVPQIGTETPLIARLSGTLSQFTQRS